LGTTAALGLALAAPAAAHAQAQTSGTRFGVEVALANKSLGFGVGAFVKFHVADVSEHPITGRASFDYYFPSSDFCGAFTGSCGYKYWEASADGLIDITNKSSNIKPYVGVGLTYANVSFSGNSIGLQAPCHQEPGGFSIAALPVPAADRTFAESFIII
jgi:hypothetical protein